MPHEHMQIQDALEDRAEAVCRLFDVPVSVCVGASVARCARCNAQPADSMAPCPYQEDVQAGWIRAGLINGVISANEARGLVEVTTISDTTRRFREQYADTVNAGGVVLLPKGMTYHPYSPRRTYGKRRYRKCDEYHASRNV